jgi:predicted enzyme related to lactoylglutathione lyase
MNLNGVLIGSDDPKRLTEYYTKVFGKPAMEDSGYAGWKIGDGWITVGPHSEVKGRNTQPGRILLNIESSDVKGDFAKLTAAGAKVAREPTGWRDGRRTPGSRRWPTRMTTTSSSSARRSSVCLR